MDKQAVCISLRTSLTAGELYEIAKKLVDEYGTQERIEILTPLVDSQKNVEKRLTLY